jgi:hypothetical protein
MVSIYINDGELPFFVHSGVLRSFPPVIRRSIMASKNKEKNTFVVLGWMDELTFELCCEFVCTGDFFVPEPFLSTVTGYAKASTLGTIMSPYSGIRMAQNYPPISVQQSPPSHVETSNSAFPAMLLYPTYTWMKFATNYS